MELGMIGLDCLRTNMVRRHLKANHRRVVYDIHPEVVQALTTDKAVGATSLVEFVQKVSSAALYERFSARGEANFADKVLSVLRYEFGGQAEQAAALQEGV